MTDELYIGGKLIIDAYSVTAEDDLIAGDDLSVTDDGVFGGDITLTAGGTIDTTANGNLVLDPNGTGYVSVGTASAGHTVGLYCEDALEVDGTIWSDSELKMGANQPITMYSTSTHGVFKGDTTNDQVILGLGASLGRQFIVTDTANFGKNHDHAEQTNPTHYWHSATSPDTNNTQWISRTHLTTDAKDGIGLGGMLTEHEAPTSLADDGTYSLPTGSTGRCSIVVGDAVAFVDFIWNAAGDVSIVSESAANIDTADTDGKFCVITGANPVVIKNRLAATHTILMRVDYTTSPV